MKHGHEKAIESPLKRCFLKQADIPLQGSEGQGSPQGARAPKGPGGSHNSQGAHHERPVEAGEALVELGGVGKEQEESCQELQERSRDKGGRRGRHETHKCQETQELRANTCIQRHAYPETNTHAHTCMHTHRITCTKIGIGKM